MSFTIETVNINYQLFLDGAELVIDKPEVEIQTNKFLLQIAGWIKWVGEAPISVSVYCEHFKLIQESLGAREDVPVTPPFVAAGFDLKLVIWTLPQNFKLKIVFEFNSHQELLLGIIRGHWESPFNPSDISPIFINSLGRSGSSLAMRLMIAHEEVACGDRPPYELKLTKYLANIAGFISNGRRSDYPFSPDDLYLSECKLGYNPFFNNDFLCDDMIDWCEDTWLSESAFHMRKLVDSFYKHLAGTQGKPHINSFCEKIFPSTHCYQMQFLYGQIKQVIIVRDPRDNLASRLCFNQLRNKDDFGLAKDQNLESQLALLLSEYEALICNYLSLKDNSITIYYEDLIRNPYETSAKIFCFCGLNYESSIVEKCVKMALKLDGFSAGHITSESPLKSIGKWSNFFDKTSQKLILQKLEPLLSNLGYL